MPRPRASKVTIYLEDSFKDKSDRMWNNLIALDCAILEEHQKAGVVIAETEDRDTSRLEKVPGVQSVRMEENKPELGADGKPVPPPRLFKMKPAGQTSSTKALDRDTKRQRRMPE